MKGLSKHLLIAVIIIFSISILTISGCAPKPEEKKPMVGLILATGGLGDKSFNDMAYWGAQRAEKELGVVLDYVEPKAIAEYEGFQRDFAKSGKYAIIICIGFDQADALSKVAAEYPNQKFAIVDMVVDKPNVASLLFKANEGGFILGVLSSLMSKTGKLGIVGGMDIPLIRDFFIGFEAGAKWAKPEIKVIEPAFVGGWADPTKGKELALGLIDMGADIIWAAAGKSGLGALEAAVEKNVWGLGVDACQDYMYGGKNIIASMTKRVDNSVFETIKSALDGTFKAGIQEKGLKEGWVGNSRFPNEQKEWEQRFNFKEYVEIPQVITSKMEEARTKIINGEIKVPRPPGW